MGNIFGNKTLSVKDCKIGNMTISSPKEITVSVGSSDNNTDTKIDFWPTPAPTFVGRDKELKQLKKMFNKHPVVVIIGMAGLGKTQLGRQFGSMYKTRYQYRYWLESDTPEKLESSFNELAKKLHIGLSTKNVLVNDVYKAFNNGQLLLIFDNVEKPEHVFDYLPTRVELTGKQVHVLVTSRWGDWASVQLKPFHLDPLNERSALEIFKIKFEKAYKQANENEWKILARALGGVPLALQVAACFILKRVRVKSELPEVLADYIKQLEKRSEDLVSNPLTEYNNLSIYKSMMMTLTELEALQDSNTQLAVTLLNVAGYLNPDEIIKDDLLPLVPGEDKQRILDEALLILMDFSLINQINRDGFEYYTINRIIQSTFRRDQMENETCKIYYTLALDIALVNKHKCKYVFEFADERASIVHQYYEDHPSSKLLQRLVRNKCYNALKAIFATKNKNQMKLVITKHKLLHSAVWSGDVHMMEFLLNFETDPNQKNSKCCTPLHIACRQGHTEIVQCLLQQHAVVNAQDLSGNTSLHYAAELAHNELLIILIQQHKALVDLIENEGKTPLLVIPYENGNIDDDQIIESIKILVESKATITISDKQGNTVLHRAARGARANVIQFILQVDKEFVQAEDELGRTAMHVIGDTSWVVTEDCVEESARVLAKYGLTFNKKDNDGNTPLETVKTEFKNVLQKVANEYQFADNS